MLKIRFASIAAVLVMLLAAGAARAGKQDFTLVNRTGLEITSLYISTSATNDWEEDILGVATLADGASANISFAPKESSDLWDVKIVDADGDSVVWTKLNLSAISKVTLHYAKGGTPTADLE